MAQVRLLVGTRKAAFLYTSDEKRRQWKISEPMMPGWSVLNMAADTRIDPPRLYAAANHAVWGPSVSKSTDGGKTWEQRSEGLGFPQDMGIGIDSVWSVQPGPEPGQVYAGTAPAGLFLSDDGGETWQDVESITRHQFRPLWQPVPGGSPLHSIAIDPRDPKHMYISISAGGSYVTTDGCESWEIFSHHAVAQTEEARVFISQIAANVPAGIDPASIFDFHRMRMDAKDPDRLWGQAHWGTFRSDDGGQTWEDVTAGLPHFHGFPIAVTQREPDAVFVVPLDVGTDNFRVCPGQFAVYRTRDAGATWERLTEGLPGPNDYQSVYREGLDTDGLDPEGVYVGTSNGMVYASADGGDHWQELPGRLPPVLSVTCAVQ